MEVAGEIVEISPHIDKKYLGIYKDEWKVGDRVMALLPGGGYAQYTACHVATLMRIPCNFSYEEAAAIPEVYLTSYQVRISVMSCHVMYHLFAHLFLPLCCTFCYVFLPY
jgi:NADPH:quinone reductase-like Zn-dependent oxidoreductase